MRTADPLDPLSASARTGFRTCPPRHRSQGESPWWSLSLPRWQAPGSRSQVRACTCRRRGSPQAPRSRRSRRRRLFFRAVARSRPLMVISLVRGLEMPPMALSRRATKLDRLPIRLEPVGALVLLVEAFNDGRQLRPRTLSPSVVLRIGRGGPTCPARWTLAPGPVQEPCPPAQLGLFRHRVEV